MGLNKIKRIFLFAIILCQFSIGSDAKNFPDSLSSPKRFAIGAEILMLGNYAFFTGHLELDILLRTQINKNFAAYGHFCYSSKYEHSNPFPTIFNYSCFGYAERIGLEYQIQLKKNSFWVLSFATDLFLAQVNENFQIKIPSIYWDNIPQYIKQTQNVPGGNFEISVEEPFPYNVSARVTAKFSYVPTFNQDGFPPLIIPGMGFNNSTSNWHFYPELFLIYRFGKRMN